MVNINLCNQANLEKNIGTKRAALSHCSLKNLSVAIGVMINILCVKHLSLKLRLNSTVKKDKTA